MYLEYYGLTAQPFQLSPDPRFYFGSSGHRKALAYLTYGLEQGEGFVIITGEVGAGKTTMIEYLLTLLKGGRHVPARIVTTQVGADDTLRMMAAAFGLDAGDGSKAALLTRLEAHFRMLRGEGRRPLLIVDEVQNLALPALEELRMLSNFQVGHQAVVQTLLVGQPQFRATLAGPDLEQLRQRVSASYHLGALARAETEGYVRHRLQMVGWSGRPGITAAAFDGIQAYTGGVPRRINALCTRLLLFGALDQVEVIDDGVVRRVGDEWLEEGAAGASPATPAQRDEVAGDLQDLKRRVNLLEAQMRQPPAGIRSVFGTRWTRAAGDSKGGVRP